MLLVFQEECNGKRSRNPSTSSSYGLRIGGYRSRRASEGDDGASSSSRGGARSRGSSRHSSGGQDRKPAYRCAGNTESKSPRHPHSYSLCRGRYSDQSDTNGWIVSSSYQDKLNARLSGQDVGRRNPSGPRKRANSASEKVVTVSSKMALQPEP